MKFAESFLYQMLVSIAFASPLYAHNITADEELLSSINLGRERSIFQHQPSLTCFGQYAESRPILRTNIYALLANPAQFAGKKVAFTGHFGRAISCSGNPILNVYASDFDRKGEILNNSFRISLKPIFQHQELIELGDIVDVVGLFKPRSAEEPSDAMGWFDAGSLESASVRVLELRRFVNE